MLALTGTLAPKPLPEEESVRPRLTLQELHYYQNVRSVVDWSTAELAKALPQLKRLEPAQGQEELPSILQKVGENVEAFFRSLPNTTSIEEIRQERLDLDTLPGLLFSQQFHYLALARSPQSGPGMGDEYRTNAKGRRVEPHRAGRFAMITKGFVSMPVHFHPLYQSQSRFRYLGRQMIDGRETYVVAFAQRPEAAQVTGRIKSEGKSALILIQGVAWVDATTYHVIRMQTELLAPRPDLALARLSTEIDFVEVRFRDVPLVFWLPRQVVVTLVQRGRSFRNSHHYSGFKVFTVEAEEKRSDVMPAPPAVENPN